MRPLNRFAASLRERHGAVPDFDPLDGGTAARLLLVLETPGPGTAPTRFVSRDNPHWNGRQSATLSSTRPASRGGTSVIWNAVPWIIHAPDARNRPPRRAEKTLGLVELPPLLELLPRLAVVVLAGRVAAEAEPLDRGNPAGTPGSADAASEPHDRMHQPGDPGPGSQRTLGEAAALVAAAS